MLHICSKLDVQVSRKPVGRLQLVQDVSRRGAAQRAVENFLLQKHFPAEQLVHVAIPGNVSRPVMGHENVYRASQLLQAEHFYVANVIDRSLCILCVGSVFKVTSLVVLAFVDA